MFHSTQQTGTGSTLYAEVAPGQAGPLVFCRLLCDFEEIIHAKKQGLLQTVGWREEASPMVCRVLLPLAGLTGIRPLVESLEI